MASQKMIQTCGLTKRFPKERMGSYGASWDLYIEGFRHLLRTHRADRQPEDRMITVLDHVDLDILDGEFFGLLGPNGAGKSTLIKILCTLMMPDGGEAYLNGYNVVEHPNEVKASISVMVSQGLRGFDQTLSARHNLEFFASLYNMMGHRARERIDRALRIVGMVDDADKRMMVLSSGQKQRIALARGLVVDAPVLLMDEATVMLDPRAAKEFRSFSQTLNQEEGKTVLWCTHLIHEAEELYSSAKVGGSWDEVYTGFDWTENVYFVLEARERVAGEFTAVIESTSVTNTVDPVTGCLGIKGCVTSGKISYFDWILVRKFVSPEPGHGAWGTEESSTPGNWLDGWGYRKSHVITSAAGAGTGYQIRIVTYYGSGSDSGQYVYLAGKCRSDFGDVRFTDDDGTTLLDYWMESKTDSSSATFWVEVSDNLGAGDATIYLYYGKSSETTTSNGGNTFPLLFDDFANLNSWTVRHGTWSIESGAAKCVGDGLTVSDADLLQHNSFSMSSGKAIRSRMKTDGTNVGVVPRRQDANNLILDYLQSNAAQDQLYSSAKVGGSWSEMATGFDWAENVYYVLEARERVAGEFTAVVGSTPIMNTVGSVTGCLGIKGCLTSGKISYFDWILVRKFVSPEPGHGAWGTEEARMCIGYYQVFDMNMSKCTYYGSVPSDATYHIQNAAGQSNIIVIPDRIYVPGHPLYDVNLSYANCATDQGLEIIFDISPTLRWYWFNQTTLKETERISLSVIDCSDYKSKLGANNAHVRAIYLFDEPVRGPDGENMNSSILDHMYRNVSKDVWSDKPTILMFHRQGNAPLDWTNTSFDQIASGYIQYCDWIGVDPYCYPRYQNTPIHDISMIAADADWALLYGAGRPLVLVGQSYDPPVSNSRSEDGWYYSPDAGFFEQDNDQTNAYVMPDDTYMWQYYNVATRAGKRAKVLLWWWYPDAYASSFGTGNEQMGVLPVHNVWADQHNIWVAGGG